MRKPPTTKPRHLFEACFGRPAFIQPIRVVKKALIENALTVRKKTGPPKGHVIPFCTCKHV